MTALELLAPAKDLETGISAITHGADAVYIAAEKFGAREKAGNPLTDIEQLCRFAHGFHARVYVTVNTIIFDNELEEVKNLIHNLYEIGADAVIIQDYAILNMDIPPIALHASTQMHNISPEQVRFLESAGINRVVLPRELTLEEIKEFRRNTNAELEFFIHGALCVSYSGQCYMSEATLGRSANRGACAQPCRHSYSLIDEHGNALVLERYLLSLRDLNLSNHIVDLINAGITSFKIEGRLKDITYVKNVTAYYNQLLNSAISQLKDYKRASSGTCRYSFTPDPERTFNRGFSNHFIQGRTQNQASLFSPKSIGKKIGEVKGITKKFITISSNDTISNGDGLCYFNLMGDLVGFRVNKVEGKKVFPLQVPSDIQVGYTIYRNEDAQFEKILKGKSAERKITCRIGLTFEAKKIIARIEDEDGICASIEKYHNYEPAKKLDYKNQLENQFLKSGDTIFKIANIKIFESSPVPFIPAAAINGLRRELLSQLHQKRLESHYFYRWGKNNKALQFPQKNITYKGNVANRLSREFLLQHGAITIENAFEVKPQKTNAELMVTRYCIKFELGICPNKQGGKPTGKLFLKRGKMIFPLIFDCSSCQMKVMQPK